MFTTTPPRRRRPLETFAPGPASPSAATARGAVPSPPLERAGARPRHHADVHELDVRELDAHDPDLFEMDPLFRRVRAALSSGDPDQLRACAHVTPADERDELLTMLALHQLSLAPLHRLGPAAMFHGHPAAAGLQHRLHSVYLDRLARRARALRDRLPDGVAGVRRAAAIDRVPAVYRWLRADANLDELVHFVAVEGGPDAGFDDLVAIAQVGLGGVPKLALAENYWDEMGRGRLDRVHTELHHRLVSGLEVPRIPLQQLPTAALDRLALNGVLATARWLQPELLGALGVIELQAGPRCRAVVDALERLDADEDTVEFYREHAEVDPRHGKDWLDRVVEPLAEDPSWARRMVDGALWRHLVNDRFFRSWLGRLHVVDTTPLEPTPGQLADVERLGA